MVVIAIVVLESVLLFSLSKINAPASNPRPLLLLSQFVSIVGTTLLSVSFVLAGRFRVMDKLFGGLDRMYRTHHVVSGIAYILLLHHPILLILDKLPNLKAALLYIIPSSYIPYTVGILSLWTLTMLIVLTLYVDLPYDLWKKTHEYMGVALLFAVLHVYLIPSDVSRYLPLRIWMLTLLACASASYVYKRFLYRLFGPRYAYTVAATHRTGDVIEFVLSPVGKQMHFIPGQFAFLIFSNRTTPSEEHPFSMCGAPQDTQLRFCAKVLGDFTLTLRDIKVGDQVTVTGPYGAFGERFLSGKPAVCIAGGIGITPFLSMIAAQSNSVLSRPVHLIYSVTSTEDAVGQDAISRFRRTCPAIDYRLYTTAQNGRLTGQKVRDLVGDMTRSVIFLCGPQPMMASLSEQFVQMGVKRKNIVYEDFRLK